VKRLLDEQKLGRVHSFQVNCFWNRGRSYYNSTWKGSKALDGGTLFTQFSHFIDLLIWFLGEEQTVEMFSDNYLLGDVIEFEDTGSALIKMKNGAIGSLNFTITSYRKNMEGSITLFGEKGTVKIGGQYLNTLEYFEVDGETQPDLPRGNLANDYGSYQGSMSNHDKVYDQVIFALDNKAHDLVEGEEAAKTVRMIERLYSSLKN
jgi:UDP-N-acetyl-2-amino-2-deoxyglucuronate dehydrogenase